MKKFSIFFLLIIITLGCVGLKNIHQRQSDLMSECKKMLNEDKATVINHLQENGFNEVVKEDKLSDTREVIILKRKLIRNGNRYVDVLMLVFEDGKLQEYQLNIKD